MNPNESWINDWRCGVAPAKERDLSRDLLRIFQGFWEWSDLDNKSKTARQRYRNSLHGLGGWVVKKAVEEGVEKSALQMLVDATSGGEGPLIHWDREEWQKEMDTVCRKLRKFLLSQC